MSLLLYTFRFMIPMNYFWASRLRDKKALLSLVALEWMPQLLVLAALSSMATATIPLYLGLAYLAFISIYEIGYLTNDIISVRFEENPRRRFGDREPSLVQFSIWIIARIGVFIGLTIGMGLHGEWWWWGFFIALSLVFGLHNFLKDNSLRIATFVGLAMGRILAPVLPFLTVETLRALLIPFFLNYVLFRLLAYMESKNLLQMPERKTGRFRIGFYLALLPASAMVAMVNQSLLPMVINGYYLGFWVLLTVLIGLMSQRVKQ